MAQINELFYEIIFKHKNVAIVVFVFIVAIATALLYQLDTFERLELLTIDYRFKIRNYKFQPSDIVFIDMAEDSIQAIGRWPWPRKWHATLVSILTEYDPKAIAFDVVFSEPQDETDDGAFEEALQLSRITYLPMLFNIRSESQKKLAEGRGVVSVLKPIERFRQWEKGTGHLNAIADNDGIFRRISPVVDYEGKNVFQLGFKVGTDTSGLIDYDIKYNPKKHEIVLKRPTGQSTKILLDKNNQLLVNWKGKWGEAFKHYSYIDVITSFQAIKDGKKPLINLNEFKDKICLIGLTAEGLHDIKPIPLQKNYPGVGIHANIISNIVNNDFVYEAPRMLNILLILLVSVLSVLYLSRLRALGCMYATTLSITGYALFSVFMFRMFNILVATFYPIFAIFVSYLLTTTYTQILETVEKTRLFKQATRDGLTNLWNIRHFNMLFEAEFKNIARFRYRKLSIILSDIDDFKHVNDTYGHQAGDIVLKEVANVMRTVSRKLDVVARYGGEEFIIMLIGTGEDGAKELGEKIRAAFEAKQFKFGDKVYKTTISLGVAEFKTEKTKEELIEKADQALYTSKREGKNRVTIWKNPAEKK